MAAWARPAAIGAVILDLHGSDRGTDPPGTGTLAPAQQPLVDANALVLWQQGAATFGATEFGTLHGSQWHRPCRERRRPLDRLGLVRRRLRAPSLIANWSGTPPPTGLAVRPALGVASRHA